MTLFVSPEPTDLVAKLVRLAAVAEDRYTYDLIPKAIEAVTALKTQGGFSFDVNLDPLFNLHYVVSIKGAEITIPLGIVTYNDILSYRAEHEDALESGLILGGWVDGSLVYLDLSRDFLDLNQAMQSAEENGQLAVWDSANDFAIPVGLGEQRTANAEFSQFFTDATGGGYAPTYQPQWQFQDPQHQQFHNEFLNHSGNFDQHIETSIPDYRGNMTRKGVAITKAFGSQAAVLDLMGSEGSWGKALTATGGNPTTTLDANMQMHQFFNQKSTVPGATHIPEAFGEGFTDHAGTPYQGFNPPQAYDVVNESMGFQFISPDRAGQIAQAKQHLKPGGLFLTDEKVVTPNYQENEAAKDQWKSQFFSPDQLAQKQQVVNIQGPQQAGGMMSNMVPVDQLEQALKGQFKFVQKYWESFGNFVGYAASDNELTVQRFISAYDAKDVPSPTQEWGQVAV